MAEVILLSDILVHGNLGDSRYMGPYVLASELERAGFDTIVIDYFLRIPDFFEYLKNFLEKKTLMLGISSSFLFPFEKRESHQGRASQEAAYSQGELWHESSIRLQEWMARLKATAHEFNPEIRFVLGGAKALAAVIKPDVYRDFDFVALSASDTSIVDLARNLRDGTAPKLIREGSGKILDNREALMAKRCPETVLSPKLAIQPGESLPLEISRGCIFNCKFCHYDKKESARKELRLLRDELLRNYERFGTTVYHFCDDCFNDSRVKVEETCGMLIGLPFKIEWISYARVDVAVRFPHTMQAMIEAGAKGLYLGLESLNPTVAKNSGKGTPIEKVKEFLIDFRDRYSQSCLLQGSLIVGLPGESEESQMRTMDWIFEHRVLDYLGIGPLGITPYSAKLDKLVIDYADYSRNPGKYGFKSVSFDPYYWEHDTMNSVDALQLSRKIWRLWKSQPERGGLINSIWAYPNLKSLGYSWGDILSMSRDPSRVDHWREDVTKRFSAFRENYHQDLANKNQKARNLGCMDQRSCGHREPKKYVEAKIPTFFGVD